MLKKNKTIAGVLAMFTGTIGLHHFYMGDYKKGLIYLLFFWTGVPTILGILDGARFFTQVAEESETEIEKSESDDPSSMENPSQEVV